MTHPNPGERRRRGLRRVRILSAGLAAAAAVGTGALAADLLPAGSTTQATGTVGNSDSSTTGSTSGQLAPSSGVGTSSATVHASSGGS